MGHIEGVFIAAYDENNEITAPAASYLEIIVIGGTLTLRGRAGGEAGMTLTDEPEFSIEVPARSTLIALRAAVEEDEQQ